MKKKEAKRLVDFSVISRNLPSEEAVVSFYLAAQGYRLYDIVNALLEFRFCSLPVGGKNILAHNVAEILNQLAKEPINILMKNSAARRVEFTYSLTKRGKIFYKLLNMWVQQA